ncbi:heme-binding protein 1 [Protopterus annectens]|uniref:heme-binding protein 1 n=1 Tax=Protopterus annectens TaxID=7888 RepID=UPI001CF9C921|nr:heme-binding protein 1 [Protopterus annectens]
MFGMIKNSLFGEYENRPCQILNSESKDELNYEERSYEGGKFATTEVTGKQFDDALKEAMPKMMKYMGGMNDKGIGMGMSVPVSITAFPNEDNKSLQNKVKVLLWIPSKYQAEPPKPTDESISIEEREGVTVYTTQFGGFAKESDYAMHAAKLQEALGEGVSYHKDFYFCNGYDPPMKPYGRRNEVWLVKKE